MGVCTVVGFPLGATTADVKQYETRRVIFDGATEVDMVINIGALKSGDVRTVQLDIEAVADACRAAAVVSKVIIETALLTDEEKVTACTLAKAAGATFVKTSTGFARHGATPADVALMRRVVGAEMGVKAAGGVRDLSGAEEMVRAGATRIGASAGVKIVQESKGGAGQRRRAGGYWRIPNRRMSEVHRQHGSGAQALDAIVKFRDRDVRLQASGASAGVLPSIQLVTWDGENCTPV